MPIILKDAGWVRFIVMMLGIVMTFTFTVATKNSDVNSIRDNALKNAEAMEKLRDIQSEDHDELIRRGAVLENLETDVREIKQDIKKILQKTKN